MIISLAYFRERCKDTWKRGLCGPKRTTDNINIITLFCFLLELVSILLATIVARSAVEALAGCKD